MSATRPSMGETVARAIDRRERRQSQRRWIRFVAVAVLVLVLDQVTKAAIRGSLEPRERVDLIPGLQISRVANEGIAFGLFPGRQSIVAVLTVVALSAIAIALAGLVARNATVAVGAGLLVGGSLGNLTDRLTLGHVVDFIDFARWPAFNVADCGITIGAVLIVVGLMQDAEGDEQPA